MNSRKRKVLSILFSAVVFAVFAIITGLETTIEIVSQTQLIVYGGAIGLVVFSYWLRSYVWHRLFVQLSLQPTLWQTTKVYFGSFGIKLVLPMGHMTLQPVIAYTIARKNEIDTEKMFAAISVGDTFNFIPFYSVGLIGFFVLVFRQTSTESLELYLVSLVISLAVIIGLVLAFFYRTELIHTLLQLLISPLRFIGEAVDSNRIQTVVSYERIERQFWDFYEQVGQLLEHRWETTFQVLIAHLGVVCFVGGVSVVSYAVQLDIGFFIAAVMVALSRVGSAVPTPGGVGGIESIMIAVGFALLPYSVGEVTAVVILFRLISYWGIMGLGLLFADELGSEWSEKSSG